MCGCLRPQALVLFNLLKLYELPRGPVERSMVPSISTFVVSLFSFSFVKSYDSCAAAAHARGRMCVRASGCNHASPMDRYGI